MDREEKLAQDIAKVRQLAKENEGIDANMLVMNALKIPGGQFVSARTKRWAFLISLAVPPFGLLFAVKYFLSSETDAKTVGWICVGLTVFSTLLAWITFSFMLSGTSLEQIQQINPNDFLE